MQNWICLLVAVIIQETFSRNSTVKPSSDTDVLELIIKKIKKSLHKQNHMLKEDVTTDDDNEDSDKSIDSLHNKYENLDKTSAEMDQSSTKEIFIESHGDIQHGESNSLSRNIEKEATKQKLRTQSAMIKLLKLINKELKSFKDNNAKDATAKDNLTITTKETPNDNGMLYRTPKEATESEKIKLRIAEMLRNSDSNQENLLTNKLLRNKEQMKTKNDIQELLTERMLDRLVFKLSQFFKSSAVLDTTPTAKDSVEIIEINI